MAEWQAYAAPIPRDIYDKMAETRHPVARRLMQVQRESIEELWVRANASGTARRGLPDRCAWLRLRLRVRVSPSSPSSLFLTLLALLGRLVLLTFAFLTFLILTLLTLTLTQLRC